MKKINKEKLKFPYFAYVLFNLVKLNDGFLQFSLSYHFPPCNSKTEMEAKKIFFKYFYATRNLKHVFLLLSSIPKSALVLNFTPFKA